MRRICGLNQNAPNRLIRILLPIVGAVGLFAPVRTAVALAPEEIAIIAAQRSRQSRELAEYYARVRGIPKDHICLVDFTPGEGLKRADWESRVRPSIRAWLTAEGRDEKIRCLVTVWDVPLKIGAVDPIQPRIAEVKRHLEKQRRQRQEQVLLLAADIDKVLPTGPAPERPAVEADAPAKAYGELLESALKAAQARLKSAEEAPSEELAAATRELETLFFRGSGTAGILRTLQSQLEGQQSPRPEMIRAFDVRRGELAGVRAGLNALAGFPESVERDMHILWLLQQSEGLLGTLNWAEQHHELWKKNETYASFDSELALVLWPPHALLRWLNNSLGASFSDAARETLPKTMMVARLDAPTFERARQIVDAAVEAEKSGLDGKFYIDARGMQADKTPGSYGDYDQSLRDLAQFLKDQTQLDVVLNNEEKLFQPGECPRTALYCGWYSLANYVDAFEWQPGAVGYHLASGEAATLRDPKSNVWCKRMLEKGVCATLGPTFEPYLIAFPRPLDFFVTLLSGKFTLAETYARTIPHSSWVMTLVGDPLYNPYRGRPAFDELKLPESLRRLLSEER